MVKKGRVDAWTKNNLREIRRTLGRYIAILAIIAIGVGFFSGLKVSQSAMLATCSTYVNESAMYDLRLISTLGLTSDDVEYFNAQDGVVAAEGACFADFLYYNKKGEHNVLTAHSITEDLNHLNIKEGRLPNSPDECVADALLFDSADIGTKIVLSDSNPEDTLSTFKFREYTIVGLCTSVNYFNIERGTSQLGSGSVYSYIYIPIDGFNIDYYTQIFVDLDVDGEIYSDEYDSAVAVHKDELLHKLDERGELRKLALYEEIDAELFAAQEELDAAYDEYEAQKASVEDQLSAAYEDLLKAYDQIVESEQDLIEGERKLVRARAQYETAYEEYQAGLAEFNEQKAQMEQLFASLHSMLDGLEERVIEAIRLYDAGETINIIDILTEYAEQIQSVLDTLEPSDPLYSTLSELLESIQQTIQELDGTETAEAASLLRLALLSIRVAQGELVAYESLAYQELDEYEAQLNDAKAQLNAAAAEIAQAENEIERGWALLEDAKNEFSNGMREFSSGRLAAMKELRNGKRELDNAQAELDLAWQDVYDIVPGLYCYALDRNSNTGYACFESDSGIVSGIAKVFPLFFFLVAILVCTTTMSRMVNEQRTQIGTFKALGYSDTLITFKYLAYSGSAALIGCVLGYFIGIWLFPSAIWMAYGILYNFGPIEYVLDLNLAIISLGLSMICSIGVTWVTCRGELSRMPASLMRPSAPKAGKRIFIERIPVIWNRIRFLQKVSIRNIIRYKKRMFMMLVGIGGCTALILTGFGLGDCIANLAEDQFDEIMLFDYTIFFGSEQTVETIADFEQRSSEYLAECVYATNEQFDYVCKDGRKSLYVVATDDEAINNIMGFADDGVSVEYPERGKAIVSKKAAELAGIKVGDSISLYISDTETVEIEISGIFDNYIYNYLFMTGETYSDTFNTYPVYKVAYATDAQGDTFGTAQAISTFDDVEAVSVVQELRDRVENMMESLNYVVLLVILSASALAFIVIYNLTYINITERAREIATIKVLGFYSNETYAYVFRENAILTVLGTAVGIPLGLLLLKYVMGEIKIDFVSFNSSALPQSYLYTVLISFGLTYIVSLMLRQKIANIDMADSLKSVE